MPQSESQPRAGADRLAAWWQQPARRALAAVVTTVGSCMRHRVTGLAAEAAFFAVVSVPPLIFALAGAIGYVSDQFSAAQVADVRQAVIDLSSRALTDSAVDRIIEPTINDVLEGGRFDVISLGFVLALWSGSRALNVFVDTITIMHGLGGHRGIVKTRALSFLLYILAMITGMVAIPLVVAGPTLVRDVLPERFEFVMALLLAGRHRALHLLPGDALPRVGPGADELELQPPGRDVRAGLLDRRVRRCCAGCSRSRPPTRGRSTGRWPRRSPYCCGSTSWRSPC